MVEGVLVNEMRFVHEQHRERALARELLDVFADGMKDIASRGSVRNTESMAIVTVKVASSESDVVAVVSRNDWSEPSAWRKARRTQVFPAPGSPVMTACLRSCTQAMRSSTRLRLLSGSQSLPSSIFLENGLLPSLKVGAHQNNSSSVSGFLLSD